MCLSYFYERMYLRGTRSERRVHIWPLLTVQCFHGHGYLVVVREHRSFKHRPKMTWNKTKWSCEYVYVDRASSYNHSTFFVCLSGLGREGKCIIYFPSQKMLRKCEVCYIAYNWFKKINESHLPYQGGTSTFLGGFSLRNLKIKNPQINRFIVFKVMQDLVKNSMSWVTS